MKNLLLPMFGLCTLIFACQAPASDATVDMDAIQTEIQALEDAYAASSNAKDAEAQMAYYAEDANSLPPGEPMIMGRAAILERTKKEMADEIDDKGSIKFTIVDLYAAGDYAVEVGKWVYTGEDGSENTGKYMSLFEKRDGKYVCIRDIWNADSKPPAEDMEDEASESDEEMGS